MNTKFLTIIGCCLVLAACSSTHSDQTQNGTAYTALGEAATSVNQSLTKLKATEQAAYPPQTISEPPDPASYGMAMPATIDWNGPVGPLVKQIAHTSNYKLRVLGNEPAVPVVVSIDAKNTPIGNVLRDAGYQCGNRAHVIVYPSTRTIELRYTN